MRGICNLQFRQYGTVLPYELAQGLHTVAHTLEIATGNRNASVSIVSVYAPAVPPSCESKSHESAIRNLMKPDHISPVAISQSVPVAERMSATS